MIIAVLKFQIPVNLLSLIDCNVLSKNIVYINFFLDFFSSFYSLKISVYCKGQVFVMNR